MARRGNGCGPVLLILLLAALAAVALATQFPDAELIRRATGWPVLGPWVERFRALYVPAEGEAAEGEAASTGATSTGVAASAGAAPEVDFVIEYVEPEYTALPKLWLEPETELHAEPSTSSAVTARVHALSNFGWIERRGDWFLVRRGEAGGVVVEGWVRVEDLDAARPQLAPGIEPATPLAAVELAARHRRSADTIMTSPREGRCGAYRLLSDVESGTLGTFCAGVVSRLDAAYEETFGRPPLGVAAETILVFRDKPDFRVFAATGSRWRVEASGRASAADGYAALAWDESEAEARSATLIHELTHLVNRRALGPALPAWLAEGLADTLAERLVGGKAEAARWRVGMDLAAGELPPIAELLGLSSREFYEGGGFSNYARAHLWVEFLSSHAVLGERFESFLDAVAEGDAGTAETLESHLARPLGAVEEEWRAWVRAAPGRG